MVKLIGCILLATLATGCTYGGLSSYGDDFVEMRGTPAGIAALSDYHSGLVTNGKASPDVDTPYWNVRRAEALARLTKPKQSEQSLK